MIKTATLRLVPSLDPSGQTIVQKMFHRQAANITKDGHRRGFEICGFVLSMKGEEVKNMLTLIFCVTPSGRPSFETVRMAPFIIKHHQQCSFSKRLVPKPAAFVEEAFSNQAKAVFQARRPLAPCKLFRKLGFSEPKVQITAQIDNF